ncbi:DNA polymerase IV [Colidextribacter sp. OB.20]|uniref:DNA polymerase Y family protein n=1 Tax=Colidextribacter sp. OB.20 TaxID=2304568 RepID=UPI00136B6005|nr:DNA polymerase IV [Colidextribacter sp. OB.20]NBI09856.1 DNA polymerase IV [Colidextribacter sp. OB.20]
MDRVIFHCDLNSFYASVELLSHPELRHLPVAVCGDPNSRHGIILAKNEPAKAFQVKTAETIWQARKKCPDLTLLPAHHGLYQEFSRKVNSLYQEYTDLVEPFGIDESWLDVTGTLHLFGGDAKILADQLRSEVRGRFGLTISVGVSFNKVFAKLGSDYKKPDATTVITRENFRELVWPLPVTDLLYVGRAAARTFEQFGIRTIGQLAAFDREQLYTLLGKNGAQLHSFACGEDSSPVAPAGQYTPPKSIGNGYTFPNDLQGREEIRAGIAQLADQVAVRLRRHSMKCQGISLSIRDPSFRDISRQTRLDPPTDLARELTQAAAALVDSCWNMSAPVRALTVTAIYLIPAMEASAQLDLFSAGQEEKRRRLERLEGAMDAIRSKYGPGAIAPASAPRDPGRERHAPPPGGSSFLF